MRNKDFYLHLYTTKQIESMSVQELNPPRSDGFPKIKEISLNKEPFKTNVKDPKFNEPYVRLEKDYSKQTGILIFKV